MALTDLQEVEVFPSNFSKLRLAELLAEKYPDYKWDKVYLLRGRFAQQKRLERAVIELFPVNIILSLSLSFLYLQESETRIYVRKDAQIINPATGEYLELDIWVPSLRLAFEYQVGSIHSNYSCFF